MRSVVGARGRGAAGGIRGYEDARRMVKPEQTVGSSAGIQIVEDEFAVKQKDKAYIF